MKRKKAQGMTANKSFFEAVRKFQQTVNKKSREFNASVIKPATYRARCLANDSLTQISRIKSAIGDKVSSQLSGILSRETKDFWAIDIGSSGIRLARLENLGDGYMLRDYYQSEYGTDFSSLPNDQKRAVKASVLKDLLLRANVVNRDVIVSLSGSSVFTRVRTLPPVPKEKVEQIVRYEVQQQIPFGLDQIYLDHCVLEHEENGGYEVLMAAVKEDVAQIVLEIAEKAGCRIHCLMVDGIAAYNWLKYTGEIDSSAEAVALVNIGANITEVVCEVKNQFRFTRPLNVAGNDFTRALAEAERINFAIAEQEKLEVEDCAAPEGPMLTIAERLAIELQRSFSYFRSLPGGAKIDRVVLTGGGANLSGLAGFLAKKLELPVEIALPGKDLRLSGDTFISDLDFGRMAVVLGLALTCQQDVALDINLLP